MSHKCHLVTALQENNAVHSEKYTKPINTLFEENTGFSNIKAGFSFTVSTVTSHSNLIRVFYRRKKLSHPQQNH
jgi:hypothetical protein